MYSRRDFIAGSLTLAGAAVLGAAAVTEAATVFPAGLVYTKEAPGRWAGKEAAHAPQVTVEGGTVTILTPHPMSAPHFIVKHTLLMPDGKLVGEKTFVPTDPKAESSYTLPDGFKGTLWATSFCNVHDFWVTEFTV